VIGDTRSEIEGSEYQKLRTGKISGEPPHIDLDTELNLVNFLIESNEHGLLKSAHDISEGGIAVNLAESCFTPNFHTGIICNIDGLNTEISRKDYLLFSESQSRVIVSLNKINTQKLKDIAESYNLPMKLIGIVGGKDFIIENMVNISVDKLYAKWNYSFEDTILNAKS